MMNLRRQNNTDNNKTFTRVKLTYWKTLFRQYRQFVQN